MTKSTTLLLRRLPSLGRRLQAQVVCRGLVAVAPLPGGGRGLLGVVGTRLSSSSRCSANSRFRDDAGRRLLRAEQQRLRWSSTAAAATKNNTVDASSSSPSKLSASGAAFFGSLCAGTFVLGCWQARRLLEKVRLVERRDGDLRLPPAPIGSSKAAAEGLVLADDDGSEGGSSDSKGGTVAAPGGYRRIVLEGRFLHEGEMLVGPRGPPPGALPDRPGSSASGMSSAPQGYYVVAPFAVRCRDGDENEERGRSRWWLRPRQKPEEPQVSDAATVVLVNRGWVPRQMAVVDDRRHRRGGRGTQGGGGGGDSGGGPRSRNNADAVVAINNWTRPEGLVEIVAIPTEPETPKTMLIAEHNLEANPPKLYWYDWPAMLAVAGLPCEITPATDGGDDGIGSRKKSSARNRKKIILTAVQPEQEHQGKGTTASSSAVEWPARPTAEKVGEFKISPAVHAGYAFTWFGLSTAGMVMTRKLITKGR